MAYHDAKCSKSQAWAWTNWGLVMTRVYKYILYKYIHMTYLSIHPAIYLSIYLLIQSSPIQSNPIQSTCLDYGQHRFKHPSMTFSLDIYLDMPFEISCMMLKIVMMNDYSVGWRASYFQTSWSEDCFEDALMIDLHDWSDPHRPIIDCETDTWLEWLGFKHKS